MNAESAGEAGASGPAERFGSADNGDLLRFCARLPGVIAAWLVTGPHSSLGFPSAGLLVVVEDDCALEAHAIAVGAGAPRDGAIDLQIVPATIARAAAGDGGGAWTKLLARGLLLSGDPALLGSAPSDVDIAVTAHAAAIEALALAERIASEARTTGAFAAPLLWRAASAALLAVLGAVGEAQLARSDGFGPASSSGRIIYAARMLGVRLGALALLIEADDRHLPSNSRDFDAQCEVASVLLARSREATRRIGRPAA